MEKNMKFAKLESPSLKNLFVEQLEDMILSGKTAVGEKLPSERELAEVMHVSRAVVNGGITELERKGFLEVKPRVGAFVADYRRNGNTETLLSIMNYNGGHLRDDEIRSILEVRIALDTLAAQLLIPKITGEEIVFFGELTEQMRDAQSDVACIEAAFTFQRELAILSGNTLIPLIFTSFKVPVFAMWERFCALYGRKALYENHYGLWETLRDRDFPAAVEWIKESIGASIDGARPIYY
jgi:DNA-binding FadR family transcriptional regulator